MLTQEEIERQINPAKTQKGKKILESKAPLLVENDKKTMFLKGVKTSQTVNDILGDLYKTKRLNAVMMSRKNPIKPFEDAQPLQEMMKKQDTSLFVLGSHNKKRPNNLVFGRTFNGEILDMIEFGIIKCKTFSQFPTSKVPLGAKPCLIFNGDVFEKFPETWGIIQNYFSDFFCVSKTASINLAGLEYVMSISAVEPDTLLIRSYEVAMKKSGTNTPHVELTEIGLSLDLKLRRSQFAAQDVRKVSLKVPRAVKIGKTKNITHDMAGTKMATVHMTKQDYTEMPQARMKGSKRKDKDDPSSSKKVKKVKSDKTNNAAESEPVESMEVS